MNRRPEDPFTILLVGSDAKTLEKLRARLKGRPHLSIIGEADSKAKALAAIRVRRPDLVLLDWRLPDARGKNLLERICRADPRIHTVVLRGPDDSASMLKAIRVGAAGYVLKNNPAGDLMLAIRAAQSGALYLDPAATRTLQAGMNVESAAPAFNVLECPGGAWPGPR